jgi:hypothetical protein
VIGGCGRSALSTPVLRTRVARICRQAIARESRIGTPTTAAQGPAFLRRGAAALGVELRALRALDPGGRAAPVYAGALRALTAERTALANGARTLAGAGDAISAIRAIEARLAPLQMQADTAWRTLRIPACLSS